MKTLLIIALIIFAPIGVLAWFRLIDTMYIITVRTVWLAWRMWRNRQWLAAREKRRIF